MVNGSQPIDHLLDSTIPPNAHLVPQETLLETTSLDWLSFPKPQQAFSTTIAANPQHCHLTANSPPLSSLPPSTKQNFKKQPKQQPNSWQTHGRPLFLWLLHLSDKSNPTIHTAKANTPQQEMKKAGLDSSFLTSFREQLEETLKASTPSTRKRQFWILSPSNIILNY